MNTVHQFDNGIAVTASDVHSLNTYLDADGYPYAEARTHVDLYLPAQPMPRTPGGYTVTTLTADGASHRTAVTTDNGRHAYSRAVNDTIYHVIDAMKDLNHDTAALDVPCTITERYPHDWTRPHTVALDPHDITPTSEPATVTRDRNGATWIKVRCAGSAVAAGTENTGSYLIAR